MNKTLNCILKTLATIVLTVLISAQGAKAQTALCPISELKPGLKGYGKTVVRGTKISTFDVEIIDIVKSGGYDGGDLILARFSGPTIELANGIAAGYSGSPVYFNNKLAGAISGLIPFTDAHVGTITPIENMMSIFNRRFSPSRFNNKLISDLNKTSKLTELFANSPIMISGVGPRGLKAMEPFLSNAFKNWFTNFNQAQIAAKPSISLEGEYKPEPGSAIAAVICEGDVELSALGTLTHILPDGRFLAFGHPLSGNGEVNIPLSLAYIYYVFTSTERPFKEGAPLTPIGRITADHMAGVGGKLNETAEMLPVHCQFKDLDRNITKEINIKVLPDPDIYPIITSLAIAGKVAELIDRNTIGSISIKTSFTSNDLPTPYTFSDYYSGANPLYIGILQNSMFPSMLLANNSYKEINLSSINIDIQFTSAQHWAEINNVEIPLVPGVSEPKDDVDKELKEPDIFNEAIEKTEKELPKPKRSKSKTSTINIWGLDYLQELPNLGLLSSLFMQPLGQTIPPREVKPKVVKPGTTMKLQVTIRPYRAPAYIRTFDFKIPEDCPEGFTSIIIRGGSGLLPTSDEYFSRTGMFVPTLGIMSTPYDLRSFDEISKYILTLTPNNFLIIEMIKPLEQSKNTYLRTWAETEADKIKVSIPTDHIIVSGLIIPVEISKGDKEIKSEPAAKNPPPK